MIYLIFDMTVWYALPPLSLTQRENLSRCVRSILPMALCLFRCRELPAWVPPLYTLSIYALFFQVGVLAPPISLAQPAL